MSTATEEDQTNATERKKGGEFVRGISSARNQIAKDGPFPAEKGRYHLYIANNCPWCHRVALARSMLGLEDTISMDVAFPTRTGEDDPRGAGLWIFRPSGEYKDIKMTGCTADTVGGETYVVDIYAQSGLKQRSLPILYDKKTRRVVNNESAEIIRMFGTQFSQWMRKDAPGLYLPKDSKAIDELNKWIYVSINNGAYKAGFSRNQAVYEQAYDYYFAALNKLNGIFKNKKFLCGDAPTEADIRLFPTIFRHDPVYYLRMKLNHSMIQDYPHLWRWLSNMYTYPGVAAASSLEHCKQGYFGRSWNNIIPKGPPGYPEVYNSPLPPRRHSKQLKADVY